MLDIIKTLFASKITDDRIYFKNGSFIEIEKFAEIFKGIPENPTYNDFISIDGYVNDENHGMGYKDFFDQCKAEGILL